MLFVYILAAIGFLISLYAYVTEKQVQQNPTYKAACDLSDMVSCTKVMKSDYSTLFFVSNALVGMLYYLLIALVTFFGATKLLLILTSLSMLATIALAYILFVKIKALCPVCIATYIVNIALFLYTIKLFYF